MSQQSNGHAFSDYAENIITAQQYVSRAHQAILDKRYAHAAFLASKASQACLEVEKWALLNINETEVVG